MIKILVIDDEAGVCDVIAKTFSYIGFSVFTAPAAHKGRQLLLKEKPKIVFLDIMMADADGLDLLQQIKQEAPGTVVIMLTARQDDQARQRALALGADEFITKPFSRNYLRDVVVQKIKEVLDKGGHMQKPRILLVDDEEAFRTTAADFIRRRFDCEIDEARDGASAVDKVKSGRPDVILLDIKMPGVNGIEIIPEIRRINPLSRIVVVSAWKSAEVVNQAIRQGAADYIGKPISLPALAERLRAILISIGKLVLKS